MIMERRSMRMLRLVIVSIAFQLVGGLKFEPLAEDLRVSPGAPVGTVVGKLKAMDLTAATSELTSVRYSLHQTSDYLYFAIDPKTGLLTTIKTIDRETNETYRIIVKVATPSTAEYGKFEIRVCSRSRPQFPQQRYEAVLDVNQWVGSTILQVSVGDDESAITYSLETVDENENIESWLEIDQQTGRIVLTSPVPAHLSNVSFYVIAADSGTPQLESRVLVSITIDGLSEPRDVSVVKSTSSMAVVSWKIPERGQAQGYLLRYWNSQPEAQIQELNITMPPLESTDDEQGRTLYANLSPLDANITYQLQISAWKNQVDVGRSSAVVHFTTPPDYCYDGDACSNNGECKLTMDDPGFECRCSAEYFGSRCQWLDVCLSEPCSNGGTCHKGVESGDYLCDCAEGFHGRNCTLFDPCSASISPCLNNGICTSGGHDIFECQCQLGFYGPTCQHENPCVLEPCQNSATCLNISDGQYVCHCPDGYQGLSCDEKLDPCLSSPCSNGGKCQFNASASGFYECQCLEGFFGLHCDEDVNECLEEPCQNQGTCQNLPGSFKCECSRGYSGVTCDVMEDLCLSSPCLNKAVCEWSGGSNYTCHCLPGYIGIRCETDVNDCDPNPCQNGAECTDDVDRFICDCPIGFRGLRCDEEEQCPNSIEETSRGIFHWAGIEFGETIRLPCPFGAIAPITDRRISGNSKKSKRSSSKDHSRGHAELKDAEYRRMHPVEGSSSWRELRRLKRQERMKKDENGTMYAVRSCEMLPNGTIDWMPSDLSLCREESMAQAQDMSITLQHLTGKIDSISSETLEQAAEQVGSLLEYAIKDPVIAQSLMNVISNLLDVDGEVLETSSSSCRKFLDVVDRFTNEVVLKPGEIITLLTPNIAVEALLLDVKANDSRSEILENGYSFQPSFGTQRSKRKSDHGDPQVQLTIPKEVLNSLNSEPIRLQFVSFRNGKLFQSSRESQDLTSMVLSASIAGRIVSGLRTPVIYTMPLSSVSSFYTCVYWDEEVLLDPTPMDKVSDLHQSILTWISYFGSGLSILGLSVTVLLYSLFRNLRRDRGGKILLNLSISLLLLHIIFVVGSGLGSLKYNENSPEKSSNTANEDRVWIRGSDESVAPILPHSNLCAGVAILTHYFVLSSLSWMLVEAVHMYQLLITVFANSETFFMGKRMLAAWGLPLVVVLTTSLLSLEFYKDPESGGTCRLTPHHPAVYYGTYIGPACLILLVNTVVFFMVLRVILLQGQRGRAVGKVGCIGTDHRVTMAQVRGAVTVMALLGITWVSGALAIGPLKLVLKYVFCISNSLQGFIIFIVRVVQYPEARLSWSTLWKTGQTQIRYQDGTRIHSTGPATHSSSHSQMRQTIACSTQSTGQSNSGASDCQKPPSPNGNRQLTDEASTNGTHHSLTPSESPTLPVDASVSYHQWSPNNDSSGSYTSSAGAKNSKESCGSRLNFRWIFGQFRLDSSSILKAKGHRDLGSHSLLQRHVSGATNPPPSPGHGTGERIRHILSSDEEESHAPLPDELIKPKFLIGQDVCVRGSLDPLTISVENGIIKRSSQLLSQFSSQRSSLTKEGADTSWRFLRPDGDDTDDSVTTSSYRRGKGSVPLFQSMVVSENKMAACSRRSASFVVFPKFRQHQNPQQRGSCDELNHPRASRNRQSPCSKAVSLSETNLSDPALMRMPSIVIAGQRVTVSRTPSQIVAAEPHSRHHVM